MSPTRRARALRRIPIGIRTNVFETLIALLLGISGLGYVAGASASPALDALLPPGVGKVWGVALLVGCGCMIRGRWTSVEIEGRVLMPRSSARTYRLGLRLLACGSLLYVAAVGAAAAFGPADFATFAAAPYVAFFSACVLQLSILKAAERESRTVGAHGPGRRNGEADHR